MPALNLIAVLAATVAAMVIGGVYYARPLMGDKMMVLAKTPAVMRDPGKAMGMQVVFSLLAMVALAVLVQKTGSNGLPVAGATVGFWVWAVLALADAGATNFAGRPWSLWLMNQGNWLLTFVIAGAVIAQLS